MRCRTACRIIIACRSPVGDVRHAGLCILPRGGGRRSTCLVTASCGSPSLGRCGESSVARADTRALSICQGGLFGHASRLPWLLAPRPLGFGSVPQAESLPAASQASKGASSRASQKGRPVKIAAWVRHTGRTAVRSLGPSESVAGEASDTHAALRPSDSLLRWAANSLQFDSANATPPAFRQVLSWSVACRRWVADEIRMARK